MHICACIYVCVYIHIYTHMPQPPSCPAPTAYEVEVLTVVQALSISPFNHKPTNAKPLEQVRALGEIRDAADTEHSN